MKYECVFALMSFDLEFMVLYWATEMACYKILYRIIRFVKPFTGSLVKDMKKCIGILIGLTISIHNMKSCKLFRHSHIFHKYSADETCWVSAGTCGKPQNIDICKFNEDLHLGWYELYVSSGRILFYANTFWFYLFRFTYALNVCVRMCVCFFFGEMDTFAALSLFTSFGT